MSKEIKLSDEIIAKLRAADSMDELKALAQEAGIEVPEEELAAFFDSKNKKIELEDEDLENVSGGNYGCVTNTSPGWHSCTRLT